MHPRRKLALLFFLMPLLLLGIGLAIGSLIGNNNQSHLSHQLAEFSGANALFAFVYFIPFVFLGVTYWRAASRTVEQLPPGDNSDHSINVRFTTGHLKQYFNFWLSKHGTLVWNDSNKTIRLLDRGSDSNNVVFETSYASVQKLNEMLNVIELTINGVRYVFTPDNFVVNTETTLGMIGGQGATIVTGAMQFSNAGITELGKRLAAEGVKVITVRISYSIRTGILVSFVILYVGAILISLFVVN